MRPRGRQCASGLSLLFSAMRCFNSPAAHGVNGRPSLNPAPMLKNVAAGGPLEGGSGGGSGGGTAGGPVDTPPNPAGAPRRPRYSQIPERSGLPSDVLGAGASSFGLPSGPRGTRAEGKEGHCGKTIDGKAAMTIAAATG